MEGDATREAVQIELVCEVHGTRYKDKEHKLAIDFQKTQLQTVVTPIKTLDDTVRHNVDDHFINDSRNINNDKDLPTTDTLDLKDGTSLQDDNNQIDTIQKKESEKKDDTHSPDLDAQDEKCTRFNFKNHLHFPKVRLPRTLSKLRSRSGSAHGQLVEEICSPVYTLERNQKFLEFDSDLSQLHSKTDQLRNFGSRAKKSFSQLTTCSCVCRHRTKSEYGSRDASPDKLNCSGINVVALPLDITSVTNENVKSAPIPNEL